MATMIEMLQNMSQIQLFATACIAVVVVGMFLTGRGTKFRA